MPPLSPLEYRFPVLFPFKRERQNSVPEANKNVPIKSTDAVPESNTAVAQLSAAEEQNYVSKQISKDDEVEDMEWTEDDTSDIMDLMETALNNVKMKLLSKQTKEEERSA